MYDVIGSGKKRLWGKKYQRSARCRDLKKKFKKVEKVDWKFNGEINIMIKGRETTEKKL